MGWSRGYVSMPPEGAVFRRMPLTAGHILSFLSVQRAVAMRDREVLLERGKIVNYDVAVKSAAALYAKWRRELDPVKKAHRAQV